MKYVLVSGGVISGVGKGIIASSSGLLLKTNGLRVTAIKIDPYLNIDAGTMNPKEHGECFVLDDGGEVDLDLGNYERYLGISLTRDNNVTTGKVYRNVIEKERLGHFLGKTVQVVPHVTTEIMDHIERVARVPVDDSGEEPDVCIIELGGTVGDIESMPFVEALTQLRHRVGKGNFIDIHVSYVPIINGEQKTKPTQHSIKGIRSAGMFPDLIACRCETPLEHSTVQKIAHHCQVEVDQVVVVRDLPSIYQVPILLEEQGLKPLLQKALNLDEISLSPARVEQGSVLWGLWRKTVMQDGFHEAVDIALVGKYIDFHDSYLSVVKSLEHSAMRCGRRLNLIWIDSEHLEASMGRSDPAKYHKAWHKLCTASGILVPGGFGVRGTEGMIQAAKWARQNKKPYLGICLGMQIAVIEFARHECGMAAGTSEEFKSEAVDDRIIIFMPEIDKTTMGGTMRLGLRPTLFQPGTEWSKLRALYGEAEEVKERHRHRYEVNPAYIERLEKGGLNFIGKDDKGERMEIVELKDHPYFVGVQYHPEYLSRVLDPSKPYLGFVAASAGCLDGIIKQQLRQANAPNGVNGTANGSHF